MKVASATYIEDIYAGKQPYWLTFWGRNGRGNGTGKTFISRLIADAVRGRFSTMPPVKFTHWPSLCDRMQAHEDTAGTFSFAEGAGLLIIDDIGAEHQTPAMLSKLCRMTDVRLRKWTILTTNLSLNDWQERDSRISSRMSRDGNRHLCCETKDYALRPKP